MYRGTWKHTDIAAKEYLPIEPAQEGAAQRGQSPSDAAMAHARVRGLGDQKSGRERAGAWSHIGLAIDTVENALR